MSTDVPLAPFTPDQHRRLAVDLFNHTWTLIEQPDRTAADIDALIHAVHASRHHWQFATGAAPENAARGEWQCSRVYAVLGRGEPALWHAQRCLALCQEHGIGDWDLAFAYEALARASSIAGDGPATERWLAEAHEAAANIAEEDEREHVLEDLATVQH